MTTAKQQAKKAMYDRMREGRVGPMEAVDLISNVWEPEVERWRKHALSLSKVIDAMLATGAYTNTHKQIHDEVKEAFKVTFMPSLEGLDREQRDAVLGNWINEAETKEERSSRKNLAFPYLYGSDIIPVTKDNL